MPIRRLVRRVLDVATLETQEIGPLFRIARETARLTIGDVARRVGCSVSTIADYEMGQQTPSSWPRLFRHLEPERVGIPVAVTHLTFDQEDVLAFFVAIVNKLGGEVTISYEDLRNAVVKRAVLNRSSDPQTGAIRFHVTSEGE